MPTEHYDIVVIGGGIHGAGVAQAAAARGYSTILLEQTGLASGTSSRSSKLIHGGLRYLETAQYSLVRECLRERTLLLKLAPELVRLRPFYIPVYPATRRRPWKLRVGLSLYGILAGLRFESSFNTVNRKSWDTLDGLDTKNLQAVFRYWDAQTDDAALTRAVMQSALSLSARLMMPASFISAELTGTGCVVHYRYAGRDCTVKAGALVNAAGPWVNQVLASITPSQKMPGMDLVQGTHIIIQGSLSQGIYYMEAPRDQRAVFAMPWQGKILVGTTETHYQGDPADVRPLKEEQDYLLETFSYYFPAQRSLQHHDIVSSFAGLRVLPASGESAFRRSRETIFHPDRLVKPRLLSIYGGKLTTYRATAEKVINQLSSGLPKRKMVADTRKLRLMPV